MIVTQGKNNFHLVHTFYTTADKYRYVVEPFCLPGLFLIKDPLKMEEKLLVFSLKQLTRQKYYETEQPYNPMNLLVRRTKLKKVTGNYMADGFYLGSFQVIKPNGDPQTHVIFEFENPPGLLHIFRKEQVEVIK